MSETPREMTRADIKQAVAEFRNAAQVAKDSGFDGVQLQAGFVYLVQQFLHEPQTAGPMNMGAVLKIAPVSCLKCWKRFLMFGRVSGLV